MKSFLFWHAKLANTIAVQTCFNDWRKACIIFIIYEHIWMYPHTYQMLVQAINIYFFSFETNELSYSTWSYFESSRGGLSGICCEIGLKDGQTKSTVLNCSWWWHSVVYSEDLLWASVSIEILTWSWLRNGPCTAALLDSGQWRLSPPHDKKISRRTANVCSAIYCKKYVCKKTWVCFPLHTHAPHWSSLYCFFFCLVFSFHFRTSGTDWSMDWFWVYFTHVWVKVI